jgi:4-oxalocrotonate tautomerase
VPYITIEGGQMTTEQKQQLIERMTMVASEVMEVPSEFFITTIKELSDENIGIGGKTIKKIKEEYKKSTGSI